MRANDEEMGRRGTRPRRREKTGFVTLDFHTVVVTEYDLKTGLVLKLYIGVISATLHRSLLVLRYS